MNISLVKKLAIMCLLTFALGACTSAKNLTSPAGGDGDDDGDGVLNSIDECPNTPAGASVDHRGCEIHGVTEDTHFAFDSAKLSASAKDYLSAIARSLDGKSVVVYGYTDSVGPEAYNQGLSERRAKAVADFLRNNGVENVESVGFGEANPVAPNDTREGRALNRRVVITTASQ